MTELNPITKADLNRREQIDHSLCVDWTEEGLTIARLRLIGDSHWLDVSYCEGVLNGKPVRVAVPFSSLPTRSWKTSLFKEAKSTGKFIDGLFNAVSILK